MRASRQTAAVIVICVLLSGCAREVYELTYELRVPAKTYVHPDTDFMVVTDTSVVSAPARLVESRKNEDFITYKNDTLLFDGEPRHAVIVELPDDRSQVFVLPLTSHLKPIEWTTWKRPDYVEHHDRYHGAWWSFMYHADATRSTELPPDSFELRYKLSPQANLR